jgi:hypothetical protein
MCQAAHCGGGGISSTDLQSTAPPYSGRPLMPHCGAPTTGKEQRLKKHSGQASHSLPDPGFGPTESSLSDKSVGPTLSAGCLVEEVWPLNARIHPR